MSEKLQAVTYLMTRNCQLNCSYCRLSANINYDDKPEDYHSRSYFNENQLSVDQWIDMTDKFIKQNPNVFFLIMGGEPLMYKGIEKLINHLNNLNHPYTIVSNCLAKMPGKLEEFFEKVGYVHGFTASVDPSGDMNNMDSNLKSQLGFNVLVDLVKKGKVKDPMAGITVTNKTIHNLPPLIKRLSDEGICSDINFIDYPKNKWYDFADLGCKDDLVQPTDEVKKIIDDLMNSDYKIFMKDLGLTSELFKTLPTNINCQMKVGNIHGLVVDADGKLRTCLRIRGKYTPDKSAFDWFNNQDEVERVISQDIKELCDFCQHSCYYISGIFGDALDNKDNWIGLNKESLGVL